MTIEKLNRKQFIVEIENVKSHYHLLEQIFSISPVFLIGQSLFPTNIVTGCNVRIHLQESNTLKMPKSITTNFSGPCIPCHFLLSKY